MNNDNQKDKNEKVKDSSRNDLFHTYPEDENMISATRAISVVNLLRHRDNFLDRLIALVSHGKKVLIGVTAVATFVGFLIFANTPSRYETSSEVILPTQEDIIALNNFRASLELPILSAETVYLQFVNNLQSTQVAKSFYDQNLIGDRIDEQLSAFGGAFGFISNIFGFLGVDAGVDYENLFENEFLGNLHVTFEGLGESVSAHGSKDTEGVELSDVTERINRSRVRISFIGLDPLLSSQWLDDYVAFVNDYTAADFVNAAREAETVKEEALAFELASLENSLLDDRNQELSALNDAFLDAQRFGIINPVVGDGDAPFLRGTEMLSKQIESLSSAEVGSDALTAVRAEYERINTLVITPQSVKAMRIDKGAYVGIAHNSPHLFIVFFFILGLILSYLIHGRSLARAL